jgi:ribosomal protein S13
MCVHPISYFIIMVSGTLSDRMKVLSIKTEMSLGSYSGIRHMSY